jgi:glucosamine-6-phosphate deaminase
MKTMTVWVFPTAHDAAAALAAAVVTAIREKPSIVLGLPTGRTPVVFYRELIRGIRRHAVDVSAV